MKIHGHDVGVCSWSLQPKDLSQLIAQVKALGLQHVQLALAPLLELDEPSRSAELARLRESGIVVTSAMISFPGEDYATIGRIRETGGYKPDADWDARRALSAGAAALAKKMGVRIVSTHVGFVPEPGAEGYIQMRGRVREIADLFKAQDVDLLLETGQESAEELLAFLKDVDRDNVFINFDPANMILYGAGDPSAALAPLAPFIHHVHIKDAVASNQPGKTWGEEVPFGSGHVGATRYLKALKSIGYSGPFAIEREAGVDRSGDIQKAIATLHEVRL